MENILQDIRAKLEDNFYQNEEHVRLSLISRILLDLGWDIWNPKIVYSEFTVAPNEDYTKVDIALFLNQFAPPSVFIEIKTVGKVDTDLKRIERQLRDYNRNNTATFTILTDGRRWRFYYSQTGGEFSRKCFKAIDLLKGDLEEIENSFLTFLSKEEIESGRAKDEAQSYLQLNQKQRALEDAFPKAKKMTMEAPFPSLPEAIVKIVNSAGFYISKEEAAIFIEKNIVEKSDTSTKINKPASSKSIESNTQDSIESNNNTFPPPNNTECRFEYKGDVFNGVIRNGKLFVNGYGEFTSFSSASKKITKTSRNGWRDWDLSLPGRNDWILADEWR